MQVNLKMIAIYIYRFVIGLSLSTVIIYLLKRFENHLSSLAKYGQYLFIGGVHRVVCD